MKNKILFFISIVMFISANTYSQTGVTTQNSTTPVSSLPDGDIIWKHSKGSFEINGKEGDKRIWHEDGGRFIYVEQEFYNNGTMEGSGQLLKRKNENVFIKLTLDKCYYKDNNNQNWILIYNGGFYSKTLARYLVVDDFNKSSQSTSTTTSTSNVSANKTVSNYTFTKAPELKINYLDNRKMCCCCDQTYSQNKLKENVMIEEKIYYLTEKLADFHQQNGNALLSKTRNETQIQNDLSNFKSFLNTTYPGNQSFISVIVDFWYNSFISGMMLFSQGQNKTKPGSTERFVDKYEIISPFCSVRCKNDVRCKSCH
jgi:hypothetical protein